MILAVLSCSVSALTQGFVQPMTNASIVQMVRRSVPLTSIIQAIKSAPEVDFLVDNYAAHELTGAGASDAASDQIVEAMHQRVTRGPVSSASAPAGRASVPAPVTSRQIPPATPPTIEATEPRALALAPVSTPPQSPTSISNRVTAGTAPLVDEVGVYYRSTTGDWIQMMPEVVNWKTGGVLKSLGTAGILKGDVNGIIRGDVGRLKIEGPVALLVYCPEGTEITEYQLIRLHQHSDSREFRTVTGGVFHVSGGAQRDTIDFDSKHVAQRTWTINIGSLSRGQYGILPPGLSSARSAGSQLGKMYTFSIAE